MSPIWLRIVGVSGFSAVALGAYGAHGVGFENDTFRETWKTANMYHFIHTCALGLSATHFIGRKRLITSALFLSGIVLFSGSLYVVAITNSRKPYGAVAPYGGMMLMAGWLAVGFL